MHGVDHQLESVDVLSVEVESVDMLSVEVVLPEEGDGCGSLVGERRPSKQVAERLAECLGVPTDEHSAFVQYARVEPLSGRYQL